MTAGKYIITRIFMIFLSCFILLSTMNMAQAANENVQKVQQILKDLGYQPGPVDGLFGANTRRAIVRYQEDNNLPKTGQIDKATAKALGVEIFIPKKKKSPSTLVEAPVPYIAPSEDCYAVWKCPGGALGCSETEGKYMIPAHCLQ